MIADDTAMLGLELVSARRSSGTIFKAGWGMGLVSKIEEEKKVTCFGARATMRDAGTAILLGRLSLLFGCLIASDKRLLVLFRSKHAR